MITHPYRFLMVMALLLLVALASVVYVWSQLQVAFAPTDVTVPESVSVEESPDATATANAYSSATTTTTAETEIAPLPASELPLSDGQRNLVSALGLDVDTIVITADMIACVQAGVGTERYEAFLAGETPSLREGLSMVRCLGQ